MNWRKVRLLKKNTLNGKLIDLILISRFRHITCADFFISIYKISLSSFLDSVSTTCISPKCVSKIYQILFFQVQNKCMYHFRSAIFWSKKKPQPLWNKELRNIFDTYYWLLNDSCHFPDSTVLPPSRYFKSTFPHIFNITLFSRCIYIFVIFWHRMD